MNNISTIFEAQHRSEQNGLFFLFERTVSVMLDEIDCYKLTQAHYVILSNTYRNSNFL